MRMRLMLIATLIVACADRPGAGPRVLPPPGSPPEQGTDLFEQIDSAKRATAAQEGAIDDARTQQGLLDSLARARDRAIADTLRRATQAPPKKP